MADLCNACSEFLQRAFPLNREQEGNLRVLSDFTDVTLALKGSCVKSSEITSKRWVFVGDFLQPQPFDYLLQQVY